MAVTLFRTMAFAITGTGLVMLLFLLSHWSVGGLAPEYFPGVKHSTMHHVGGLLLGLPIPLHAIFIGLIIQKRHLSPDWGRWAWIGISASGVWLGISLAIRTWWL